MEVQKRMFIIFIVLEPLMIHTLGLLVQYKIENYEWLRFAEHLWNYFEIFGEISQLFKDLRSIFFYFYRAYVEIIEKNA